MHSLRHTFATLLIHLGRKTEQISKYVGHADVVMQSAIPTHTSLTRKSPGEMVDEVITNILDAGKQNTQQGAP
jgi:integrase